MELTFGATDRLSNLRAAESKALALLQRIEELEFIRAGRTEKDIEIDILKLAEAEFDVSSHWHKRIVRAGINTLSVFAENPPVRTVQEDDVIFIDIGPVFEDWEADVGKSYVLGQDHRKIALVAELSRQFDLVSEKLSANPDITGAALFDYAKQSATAAGWQFGGAIAGHIVAEFPHARIPGRRQDHHISPENPFPLSLPDANGNQRYWIIEIHLVSPDRTFGGFYERLAYV